MHIGLLSDVHGNLAGLRAVAAALEREGPLDHVVVAGDLLQGGPRPAEVWDILRALGWTVIQGNEDAALAVAGTVYPGSSATNARAYARQLAWAREQLGLEVLAALSRLPAEWRVSTSAGDLLVVHSSPRAMNDQCGSVHNTLVEMNEAYAGTGAAAIAFGHYHRNFVRATPFALLVNVASVGLPLDGLPLASYTVITATSDGWIVEQRRVPYDAAEEEAAARRSGFPRWPDRPDEERRAR
jgi:predicted phosphodiesterase